jgi:AcrR family transcriptional regulator
MAGTGAVDVLQDAGARVHLAHPLGVKGFAYRRAKNDQRDAADLADLMRMNRLPEAHVAPPRVRKLRELVRHPAKLVALRSGLKAGVHAVLAKQGLHIPVIDLFGVGGAIPELANRLAGRTAAERYCPVVPTGDQLTPAARSGRSRPEPRDNLQRVVASATTLFAQHGLKTTLAEVARHAGVGVATVYRRFANKDDLIYEVYAARLRAHEEVARHAAEAIDAGNAFERFFAQSINQLAADRGLRELTMGGYTRSLGWARGTAPDRLAKLLKENHASMGVHLTELVHRAKQAGQLREDFEATDMMVLSIAVQATISFGGSEHPELYRRALTVIFDGLSPSGRETTPLPPFALPDTELPQARPRQ